MLIFCAGRPVRRSIVLPSRSLSANSATGVRSGLATLRASALSGAVSAGNLNDID